MASIVGCATFIMELESVITKAISHKAKPTKYQARYQPSGGPVGPPLRLIPGLILGLILNLVLPSQLVLYI